MHTVESDSVVWCTPWSLTQRCDTHRGVWLRGEPTPWSLTQRCDAHRGVRLGGGMHTAEFFKKIWSLDSSVWYTRQSLTPWWDAYRGAWLRVMHTAEWCTPQSFLKIRISWRNQNRIRKYFNLFIRALDGFESWKKWRSKISWHTPFKKTAKIDRRKMVFWYVINFKVRMNCSNFELDCFTDSEAIAFVSTLFYWRWHWLYIFNWA